MHHDRVIHLLDRKEKGQTRPSPMTDVELKHATLCCISEVLEYFGRDAEVRRLLPNVGLTLRCLSLDLQKLQRDDTYQSSDFAMLNGEVQGCVRAKTDTTQKSGHTKEPAPPVNRLR